jgi:hypothetical protein
MSSGFGAAALARRGGNRPATVQHVEAERNEQSGAGRCAAVEAVEEDWAAAHPQSSARLSNAGGLTIIGMALSAPSQTYRTRRGSSLTTG